MYNKARRARIGAKAQTQILGASKVFLSFAKPEREAEAAFSGRGGIEGGRKCGRVSPLFSSCHLGDG